LKGKLKGLGWLYAYAVVVSYTRVYLGVHYPWDILLGGVMGALAALFSWFFIVFVKRQLIKKVLD
jgi:undecaprenyl-diphosphatase